MAPQTISFLRMSQAWDLRERNSGLPLRASLQSWGILRVGPRLTSALLVPLTLDVTSVPPAAVSEPIHPSPSGLQMPFHSHRTVGREETRAAHVAHAVFFLASPCMECLPWKTWSRNPSFIKDKTFETKQSFYRLELGSLGTCPSLFPA